MARAARTIRAISFTRGHRLTRDLEAIGLPEAPSAAAIRNLIEMGIAASRAGFLCVRSSDGMLTLAHPVSAEMASSLNARASVAAPSLPMRDQRSSPQSISCDESTPKGDVGHDSETKPLQIHDTRPIGRNDGSRQEVQKNDVDSQASDVEEDASEEDAGDSLLFDEAIGGLLRQAMQF